jgi:hypothetical protein
MIRRGVRPALVACIRASVDTQIPHLIDTSNPTIS